MFLRICAVEGGVQLFQLEAPAYALTNYSVLTIVSDTSLRLLPPLRDHLNDWYYGIPILPYIQARGSNVHLTVSAFDSCQIGTRSLTLAVAGSNRSQISTLYIRTAARAAPDLNHQTSVALPIDANYSPCEIGAAITALLPTPGTAVMLERSEAMQLVVYGVRDATTLEWLDKPWNVEEAALAQQLGYIPSTADDVSSKEGRLLATLLAVLGSLVFLALAMLIALRLYYKRHDRHSQHREVLNALAT